MTKNNIGELSDEARTIEAHTPDRTPEQIRIDEKLAAAQIQAELDYAVGLSESDYKIWKDARLLLPWVADFRRKKILESGPQGSQNEETLEQVVERLWQNFLDTMKQQKNLDITRQ